MHKNAMDKSKSSKKRTKRAILTYSAPSRGPRLGSTPMRCCHPRRGGRVPGQNVDAGALGVSPATRRVGDYGRRRCSRLDGHVGVDVVTAVDHGGVDAARVS